MTYYVNNNAVADLAAAQELVTLYAIECEHAVILTEAEYFARLEQRAAHAFRLAWARTQ